MSQPDFSLRSIADGAHDEYIRSWARAAAAWEQPFYLRFAHEMNGDWCPWSPGVNGNVAQDYVDAWRHVFHVSGGRCGQRGVRLVAERRVRRDSEPILHRCIPATIRRLGWARRLQRGASHSAARGAASRNSSKASYDRLVGLTDKPLMIAETASAEAGGEKAEWIRAGFQHDIPVDMPRVRADCVVQSAEGDGLAGGLVGDVPPGVPRRRGVVTVSLIVTWRQVRRRQRRSSGEDPPAASKEPAYERRWTDGHARG